MLSETGGPSETLLGWAGQALLALAWRVLVVSLWQPQISHSRLREVKARAGLRGFQGGLVLSGRRLSSFEKATVWDGAVAGGLEVGV